MEKLELYIQVKDGKSIGHPILSDNFRQAYPDIDTSALPPTFARFTRIDAPSPGALGPYQIAENKEYVANADGYQDNWVIRDMTSDEKSAKIALVHSLQPFPSWTFDESTCTWFSPVPRPGGTVGIDCVWDEAEQKWSDPAVAHMLNSLNFL